MNPSFSGVSDLQRKNNEDVKEANFTQQEHNSGKNLNYY